MCLFYIKRLELLYVTMLVLKFEYCTVIGQKLDENLIPDLYEKYVEASRANVSETDKNISSSRRLFKNNKDYSVHIKKLKEVNGFKRHNLLIKASTRSNNTIIYINNPVESKIPNSFLTIEEFKQALIERVTNTKNKKYETDHILKETSATRDIALIVHITSRSNATPFLRSADKTRSSKKILNSFGNKTSIKALLSVQQHNKEDLRTNTTYETVAKTKKPNRMNFITSPKTIRVFTRTLNEFKNFKESKNIVTDSGILVKLGEQYKTNNNSNKTLKQVPDIGQTVNRFEINFTVKNMSIAKRENENITSDSLDTIYLSNKLVTSGLEVNETEIIINKTLRNSNETRENKVGNLTTIIIESTIGLETKSLDNNDKDVVPTMQYIPQRISKYLRTKPRYRSSTRITRRTYGRPRVFIGQ